MAGRRSATRQLAWSRRWKDLTRRMGRRLAPYLGGVTPAQRLLDVERRVTSLPVWQRTATGVALLVLSSLLGWKLLVAPQLECYSSTCQLRAARERLLAIGVARAREGNGIEVEGRRLPERLQAVSARFFAAGETSTLIESLGDRARTHGLEWVRVDVNPAEPLRLLAGFGREEEPGAIAELLARAAAGGLTFATQRIALAVEGSPEQVLEFLHDVEEDPRLVLVHTVDMQRNPEGRLGAALVFQMVLMEFIGEDHEGQDDAERGVVVDGDRRVRDLQPGD